MVVRCRRVRRRKTTLVVIPSSQPSTAALRTIQTSDAVLESNTQLTFTWRVFAAASAATTTTSAASTNAHA